ncbi:MAG: excinuclease ABC subunit B [Candidatus Marinimicrobia bacterium]|nr:excinuclease ABC subunit B [Candidatus Neomarinimicrobiota bacterium]
MAELKVVSEFSPAGDQPKAIKALSDGIKNGQNYQTLLGITGSGKTFTMAKVIESVQKPSIILSHNKVLAAQLYGEFKTLFPNNSVEFFISYYDYYQPEAYLPVTDTFIEKDMSMNEEIDRLRLRATSSLLSRQDVIIIASVSCIYGLGSPTEYKSMLVHLGVGDTLEIKSILRNLVDIHYIRNEMVLEPGTFRVRGDILEIFPIYDEKPLRIEFFGDEIEKIYTFDSMTGYKVQNINSYAIYPAKHFVTNEKNLKSSMKNIRIELSERLKELRGNESLLEAQRLEQRTIYDLEMMTELGYCSGIENYSRHLEHRKAGERPSCLLDFFPDDYVMFIDESHVTIPQVRAMYNGDKARKLNLIEYGFRLPSALDNRPMKFEEFESSINQLISVSATPSDWELEKTSGEFVEQIIRPTGLLDPIIVVKPTEGQIDDLIKECKIRIKKKQKVLITTLTKRMAEDLTDYLNGANIATDYLHSDIDSIKRVQILRSLRVGVIDVLVGINLLREGLDLPEVSLVIVLDADKEGFLRSKSSLMQVSGRAARNSAGNVFFYADKITNSMQYVIDETNRRRKIQKDHNKKYNIVPKTIIKSLEEINLSTRVADEDSNEENIKNSILEDFNIENIESQETLDKMKREMLKHAKNLQFEQAALLRDKIKQYEQKVKG